VRFIPFFFVLVTPYLILAQQDSNRVHYQNLIAPSVLIAYGSAGTYTDVGKQANRYFQSALHTPGNRTYVDDYLTLAPAAVVYGLNIFGIEGTHNFKDRTILLGTSYITLLPIVYGTKAITSVLRPDGSEYTSFPSGHTAFAFASAEFLRQEYKHKSPWYGIAGYTMATATAGLRMYNNKHWMTDVAAGAGLGILSTQVAYWIHPWMKRKVLTKINSTATLLPQISTEQIGIVFQARF
jgi:membrane-associated phospholipid phosphatase